MPFTILDVFVFPSVCKLGYIESIPDSTLAAFSLFLSLAQEVE